MAKPGDLQFLVECASCHKRFLVERITANTPSHPPKGETVIMHNPFTPCVGSGKVANLIETRVKE